MTYSDSNIVSTDPRGPLRTIVEATPTPEVWLLKLDCGHTVQGTRHFHIKAGELFHCLRCRQTQ